MRTSRRIRSLAAGIGAALACAALPAVASADSASVSVDDPVAGIQKILTFNFQTSVNGSLYAKYRPTGGQPCAPTASGDTGSYFSTLGSISGKGSKQITWTFQSSGEFLVCFWISNYSDSLPSYSTSQVLSVRAPVGSITINMPDLIAPGAYADVSVSGQTETDQNVYAKFRRNGGQPCAPTASGDDGSNFSGLSGRAQGNYAITTKPKFTEETGSYLLCAWLASESRAVPTAVASKTYTVGSPPPPPLPPPPPPAPPAPPAPAKSTFKVGYSCKVAGKRIPVGRSAFKRVKRNTTMVCTGRTTPARAGLRLTVQRSKKKWARTATIRTRANGTFRYRTKLRANGRFSYRFLFAGDAHTKRVGSPAVRVNVQKARTRR